MNVESRGAFASFESVCVPSLPAMAWCARLKARTPAVRVMHGAGVHVASRFFVEGAWNGEFDSGGLREAWAVAGSGAELTDNCVTFVTPTHTLERLHMVQQGDTAYVSNSFAFLLAASAEQVSESYRDYQWDFMTSLRGLGRYRRSVPTASGKAVKLFYHCNVDIDFDLSVNVRAKPLPPPFGSFDEYVGMLRGALDAIGRNARSPERGRTFAYLATVSAGYDSPACAVLLREQGCDEAVTFRKARHGYRRDDDSGSAIGAILRFTVSEFDRSEYLMLPDFPEAEFLATGMGGEEVVFAPMQPVLAGRILVTGYLGDTVWGTKPSNVNDHLRMVYPGGATLGEFRLRVGFIHLPLPFIGYIRHSEVFAITTSPEMEPWTLRNDYDRPIPRRIVESAGVPRSMFGQTKMAVTQPLWNTTRLEEAMTAASFADLQRFHQRMGTFSGPYDRVGFRFGRLAYLVNERVEWRRALRAERAGREYTPRMIVSERFSRERDRASLSFHWGLHHTRRRYDAALMASGSPSLRGATSLRDERA